MKVETKELRIGNYICDDCEDPLIVVALSDDYLLPIKTKENGWSYGYEYAIPLTEEWLLKFGFEYSKRAEVWHFGENPVTKDWMISLKWIEGEDYPFYRNGRFLIKYVHQLQNLYFALTGEELTLK